MSADQEPDTLIGALVDGRYRLRTLIGEGAAGRVYLAEHERLHGRRVALKVLSAFLADPRERARFEREIRLASRISHPHIVQIHDTGALEDGRPYVVMELLEGHTLAERLVMEGPLTPVEVVRLGMGLAEALNAAHRAGVVHRDLKPANIFLVKLSGGMHPKVLDFGVAKEVSVHAEGLTRTGTAVGTPAYMSPEQFRSDPVDGRADLYALGAVLYRALSGRLPFSPTDEVPPAVSGMPQAFRLMWLHLNRSPDPIEGAPPELAAIIMQLLSKEPEERYADAPSVAHALETIELSDDAVPTDSIAPPIFGTSLVVEPPPPDSGRAIQLVGAVLVGLVVLAWWMWTQGSQPTPDSADAWIVVVSEHRAEAPGDGPNSEMVATSEGKRSDSAYDRVNRGTEAERSDAGLLDAGGPDAAQPDPVQPDGGQARGEDGAAPGQATSARSTPRRRRRRKRPGSGKSGRSNSGQVDPEAVKKVQDLF